jgi:SAM-dependent methyltransferase
MIRTVVRHVAANTLMGIPAIAKWRARKGRTATAPDAKDLDRYVFNVARQTVKWLPGADVCEIGPGDNLAAGLAMLCCGAASYTALDRFQGDYASAEANAWYTLVQAHWPADLPRVAAPDFPACVRTIHCAIEDVAVESAFDLVVSQAVGEHVSDIDAFASATHRMLKPGGIAVHNIDFSSHGIGTELEFLAIPALIWRAMGSNRGLPNRARFDDFVKAFSMFDIDVAGRSYEHGDTRWASFVLRKH